MTQSVILGKEELNLKEHQIKQLRDKLNKPLEDIDELTSEEEMTHQLIEALADKIEDMNLFISQTQQILKDSSSQDNLDFRSCSTTSLTCNPNSDAYTSYTQPTNSCYSISSYITPLTISSTTSGCSNSNQSTTSKSNNDRIGILGSGLGGASGSKKISPDTILLGSSNYEYQTQDSTVYNYGFTNSEFFAFIAGLDPVEYILVITVISILLATSLNTNEQQLVGGALIDIGVTLGNIVEQTLFQRARQNEINTKKRQAALQTDMNNIYQSLVMLQEEINALRDELNLD